MQSSETMKNQKGFSRARKLGPLSIRKILEEYKDIFDALENYDKTRELPFQRKRIDLTLSVRTLNNLKELKKKTGKPISRLIEERFS